MNSKERQNAQEHGKSIGTSAAYLRKVGATDAQINTYVNNSVITMPADHKPTFFDAARKAFQNPDAAFEHPIYNLYKQRLNSMVEYWNR